MICLMDWDFGPIIMAILTSVRFKEVSNMDKENLRVHKVMFMKEGGKMIKDMRKEQILMQTEISAL
jgi:hypothetical protein